jgi:hypothetical protein
MSQKEFQGRSGYLMDVGSSACRSRPAIFSPEQASNRSLLVSIKRGSNKGHVSVYLLYLSVLVGCHLRRNWIRA